MPVSLCVDSSSLGSNQFCRTLSAVSSMQLQQAAAAVLPSLLRLVPPPPHQQQYQIQPSRRRLPMRRRCYLAHLRWLVWLGVMCLESTFPSGATPDTIHTMEFYMYPYSHTHTHTYYRFLRSRVFVVLCSRGDARLRVIVVIIYITPCLSSVILTPASVVPNFQLSLRHPIHHNVCISVSQVCTYI